MISMSNFNKVPPTMPMKLPIPTRIASCSCLPSSSSAITAPRKGPTKMPTGGIMNKPSSVPIPAPYIACLLPPKWRVPIRDAKNRLKDYYQDQGLYKKKFTVMLLKPVIIRRQAFRHISVWRLVKPAIPFPVNPG